MKNAKFISDDLTAKQARGAAAECVPLPAAPKTASPVPWLTSIHGRPGRGNYGNPSYRGNCSGLLVKDLLLYYRPRRVLDPMTGGGTCGDVCRELGIECLSLDIRSGHDATKPDAFSGQGVFDFVWLHPPYWRMIRWSDEPRCLANAPTLGSFLGQLQSVLRNCVQVMDRAAVLALLMGDFRFHGECQALPFHSWSIAFAEGLVLTEPEIVRFSHGTTSSAKEYGTSFIPRLHDMCLLLKKRGTNRSG